MIRVSFMNKNKKYMSIALKLALKGSGSVSPNPVVGAVLVKDGRIISRGYHKEFGSDHAEIVAIRNSKENTNGATLYVTLEPCSTFGKTPPCTKAIIAAGIKKVVIGTLDPQSCPYGKIYF